jgi:hypothetical protein
VAITQIYSCSKDASNSPRAQAEIFRENFLRIRYVIRQYFPVTIEETRNVVDQHVQWYRDSCSPSLAEMMLKMRGAVSADYRAEQDRDQNQNVGLSNIKDKTIAGQTFRHLQDKPGDKSFRERVNDLLAADRPVGIYLPTSFGFHGFVIAGREDGQYVFFSKWSEQGHGEGSITLQAMLPEEELDIFSDRDCIYLE